MSTTPHVASKSNSLVHMNNVLSMMYKNNKYIIPLWIELKYIIQIFHGPNNVALFLNNVILLTLKIKREISNGKFSPSLIFPYIYSKYFLFYVWENWDQFFECVLPLILKLQTYFFLSLLDLFSLNLLYNIILHI